MRQQRRIKCNKLDTGFSVTRLRHTADKCSMIKQSADLRLNLYSLGNLKSHTRFPANLTRFNCELRVRFTEMFLFIVFLSLLETKLFRKKIIIPYFMISLREIVWD